MTVALPPSGGRVAGVDGRLAGLQLRGVRSVLALAERVGRGGRWGPVWLGNLFPASNVVTLRLSDRSAMQVPLWDGYWLSLLRDGVRYEPELLALLRGALPCAGTFVDGGANIGYWSILASELGGATQVVAVEPTPPTARRLRANASLNGDRFEVVEAALWRAPGTVVVAATASRHAGASVVHASHRRGEQTYEVPAVTLDDLLADRPDPVIVKLDVEGAEVDVLHGARETLRRDALVVYEDHGSDAACTASAYVLEELGRPVFGYEHGRVRRYHDVAEIRRSKRDQRTGYNLFTLSRDRSVFRAALGA